jgi:predicted ribosome quality control (RQC) complex YloA/Tae2 family protein
MHEGNNMSEPDDTPTRLPPTDEKDLRELANDEREIFISQDELLSVFGELDAVRAEVSRLREALDKQTRISEIEKQAYDRLALCPDHRDKASGVCVVCQAEARTRDEALAEIGRFRRLQQVAEADVSHLGEEHTAFLTALRWTPESDYTPQDALADLWRYAEVGKQAEAEVSRLQQENALLRRSLEMLTKQLEEAEREASIATEELQHPRD